MKIDIQDIVLVAVPENTRKYRQYGIKVLLKPQDDFQLKRGLVWELGVLSPDRKYFKTLRELNEVASYVVGAGCIVRVRKIFAKTNAVFKLSDLHKKNKEMLQRQLDPIIKNKNEEIRKIRREKKLREELLKDRQEYLNF